MSNAASVNLCIDAPCENQIQEITYDGTEIYKPPLTFSKEFEENIEEDVAKGDKCLDEDGKDPERFNGIIWPWHAVHTKLKDAFTEIYELSRVVAIAKAKPHLVLDLVTKESGITTPIEHVFAKRKALAQAANILKSGAESIKKIRNEQRNSNGSDFYLDLSHLSQTWHLRQTANSIIGDLSYRRAGSQFGMSGLFEVTQADETPEEDICVTDIASITPKTKARSALRVNLPLELEGSAFIKITIRKDQGDFCTTPSVHSCADYTSPQKYEYWDKTLERAQNIIYCKELFQQLAKEAVQLQASIPPVVLGNEIRATLFPGVQLIIMLCHSSSDDSDHVQSDHMTGHQKVLEHSVHQLLRKSHFEKSELPVPHPSSGLFGATRRRMYAGPRAARWLELLDMTKSQTILKPLIAQAQHICMRRRVQWVLNNLVLDVKDPKFVCHWNSTNTPTMSSVIIRFETPGYDLISHSRIIIHVMERSLKCICRDGRTMHLSYEPRELCDVILCQMKHHQISSVIKLGICMAWRVISHNHLVTGVIEPIGKVTCCVLASPDSGSMMAVQIESYGPIEVKIFIAHSPRQHFSSSPLVSEEFWENLGGHFKEVQIDKIKGNSLLSKVEYLMAILR